MVKTYLVGENFGHKHHVFAKWLPKIRLTTSAKVLWESMIPKGIVGNNVLDRNGQRVEEKRSNDYSGITDH